MTDLRPRLGALGVQNVIPTRPAGELRSTVARMAELGYASLWVGEIVERDPFAQLAAVAEASGDIVLGTNIASIYARDAMALRMAAMTLHELSGGRFVLGLGVSHEHLVTKLRGHEYEKPLTRMRTTLADYRRLPYKGPLLAGPDGEPTEPPVFLAALRPRMTRLAATAADGALPWFVPPSRIALMRATLDDDAPAGRPRPLLAVAVPAVVEADPARARAAARAWAAPYGRAPNYRANLIECGYEEADLAPPYSDRLIDDLFAWGDADAVRARLAAFADAGADHVMVTPIAVEGGHDEMAVLEALAPAG